MNNKIKLVYESLSKSDKLIADFFLQNGKDIINMNIHELSELIGTSTASVSRFVKKVLGMSFSEAKIEFAKNMENLSVENSNEIFGWAMDFNEAPKKIVSHIESVCNDVLRFNNLKVIEEVIEVLAGAHAIYLFGVGSSGIVAQDMQQKLIKLGKRTVFNMDSNFGVLNAALCTKEDVVIAISFSGNTKEVNIAAKRAKEQGAKLVVITGNMKNKLRSISDYCVTVPSLELNESRLAAIFSRYGQLFAIDIIFIGLAKRLTNSPESLIGGYKDLLKELREK
jgi:DNA-binding MurR/RpiR family transcriptional regulator